MSNNPHSHQPHQQVCLPPFPFALLASQLEDLFFKFPVMPIFCFESELPRQYDPSTTPEGISPESRQAFLLKRFFMFQTKCCCHSTMVDPDTGLRKRCDNRSSNFREILKHQREVHNRIRHFICLADGCMATFVRYGSAVRHARRFHMKKSSDDKESLEGQHGYLIEKDPVVPAESDENKGLVERKSDDVNGSIPDVTADLKMESTKSAPASSIERCCNSAQVRLRVKPFLLDLQSTIKKEITFDSFRILVFPTKHTRTDIGVFHRQNIRFGRFYGETSNKEQSEWVAVTALLDLYYGKKRVKYGFLFGNLKYRGLVKKKGSKKKM